MKEKMKKNNKYVAFSMLLQCVICSSLRWQKVYQMIFQWKQIQMRITLKIQRIVFYVVII